MDVQLLTSGLLSSCLYATVALSYFMITRATRLINFAVGGYALFAGVTLGYLVERGFPWQAAAGISLVVGALLALLTEILIVRVMQRRRSRVITIEIAIVAVLFVVEQSAGLLYGHQPKTTDRWAEGSIQIGSDSVPYQTLITIAATVALFVAVTVWLRRGRYGRLLRATGDNPAAAEVLGLPVRRVRLVALGVAGAIAATAGVLVAPQATLTIHSGTTFTLLGFIALVLGGSATAWAPLAGGVILGMLEAVSARFLGSDVRDYVLLALVLLVFTFRPTGIFAVKEQRA